MMLPTKDSEIRQPITLFIVSKGLRYEWAKEAAEDILQYLERQGYHKGLPSSIEEALNSGDGSYKP
jgi:uncharacterized protein YcgL (UPF0745 family)